MSKPANRHKSGFRGPSPDVGKDTQFRPGQSGNPSGRPKSRLISEAYRRILEEIDPKKQQSLAEKVARAVINRALRGDVRMVSRTQTGYPVAAPPYPLRPQPPRNIQAQTGTMEVLLTWNAPADMRGVDGFRVDEGNENNLVFEKPDPNVRQAQIKMEANTSKMFFVSCVSQ